MKPKLGPTTGGNPPNGVAHESAISEVYRDHGELCIKGMYWVLPPPSDIFHIGGPIKGHT